MHTMHAGTWLCCVVIVAHVVDTPTHTLATAHMLEGFRHAPQLSMHRLAHDTTPHLLRHTHAGKGSASCCVCYTRLVWLAYKREKYTALGGHIFVTACWKGTACHHSVPPNGWQPLFCNSLLERYNWPSLSSGASCCATAYTRKGSGIHHGIWQQLHQCLQLVGYSRWHRHNHASCTSHTCTHLHTHTQQSQHCELNCTFQCSSVVSC